MKRYVVAFCIVIVFGFSQNLLQNSGFESWSAGTPDHWEIDDGIYVFQESVIVRNGNFSIRDSLITQSQADADFTQTVEVQPHTYHAFRIWVWDNDPAGRIGVGINWSPYGTTWPNVYSVDSTEWQELAFTALSPSDAMFATVDVRAYDIASQWDGDAIFYIDDACFEVPSIQPPVIVRVWHTPVNPDSYTIADIHAKACDNITIVADTLYYGVNNLNTIIKQTHTAVNNDTFRFQIPGQSFGDTIFYYLKFVDNDGLHVTSDTHSYYVGELGFRINEVYYDPAGSDSGCFIEIFGPANAELDGITVVGINGSNGNEYVNIDLTGNLMPDDGFFVIAQDSTVPNFDIVTDDADLQNGPENVDVRLNNVIIDALGYGTLNGWVFTGEWNPAPDVAEGHSLGRYPDGHDTDNNLNDFNDYITLTPGQSNPMAGILEHRTEALSLSVTKNPVRSHISFASLIGDDGIYPVSVYDVTGRMVKKVIKPQTRLHLSSGIYFLKPQGIAKNCVKIVVIE